MFLVTTEFDNQMIPGENGVVVNMNGHSIFKGILSLIQNSTPRDNIYKLFKKRKGRECRGTK